MVAFPGGKRSRLGPGFLSSWVAGSRSGWRLGLLEAVEATSGAKPYRNGHSQSAGVELVAFPVLTFRLWLSLVNWQEGVTAGIAEIPQNTAAVPGAPLISNLRTSVSLW